MLISAKNSLVFVFLTITGALLASEGNNACRLEQLTISEGNQGVPASSDEVRELLLLAINETAQQCNEGVAALQEPSSPPLLAARRPRSAPLLHMPEFLRPCSLAAAVAARDIAAIQAALERGERPNATMLLQPGLDQTIIDLLRSYLPGSHQQE